MLADMSPLSRSSWGRVFDDLGADPVQARSLEPEKIPLQVKGVDLAPPVLEELRRPNRSGDHLVEVQGSRAFGKDGLPLLEACRNIDERNGVFLDDGTW